jgi:hypothetical protein
LKNLANIRKNNVIIGIILSNFIRNLQMNEFRIFNELNSIKNEIEKDMNILEKLENEIRIKTVYENNKDLSDTIFNMNKEFKDKIYVLKDNNLNMEKEIKYYKNTISEKDNIIENNLAFVKSLKDENNNLSQYIHKLKSKNRKK